jgi:hypothetical protein
MYQVNYREGIHDTLLKETISLANANEFVQEMSSHLNLDVTTQDVIRFENGEQIEESFFYASDRFQNGNTRASMEIWIDYKQEL